MACAAGAQAGHRRNGMSRLRRWPGSRRGPGALLLQVQADVGKHGFGKRIIQQLSVSGSAIDIGGAQG